MNQMVEGYFTVNDIDYGEITDKNEASRRGLAIINNHALPDLTKINKHCQAMCGFIEYKSEGNRKTVLTADTVRRMRSMRPEKNYSQIARLFGVSPGTARFAIRGDTWSHVA